MWRKPIATESESKLHEKCANVQTYHLIWKMRSWIIAWSKFDNHFIKQSHIKFQPTNLIPRENHSQGVDANPNFVLRMRYFFCFIFCVLNTGEIPCTKNSNYSLCQIGIWALYSDMRAPNIRKCLLWCVEDQHLND